MGCHYDPLGNFRCKWKLIGKYKFELIYYHGKVVAYRFYVSSGCFGHYYIYVVNNIYFTRVESSDMYRYFQERCGAVIMFIKPSLYDKIGCQVKALMSIGKNYDIVQNLYKYEFYVPYAMACDELPDAYQGIIKRYYEEYGKHKSRLHLYKTLLTYPLSERQLIKIIFEYSGENISVRTFL